MKRVFAVAVVAGALAGTPGLASAQQHPSRAYRREVPAPLLHRTRISEDSARAIAMARMPGARVQALELENEHGLLIWSWELKIEGTPGIEEVNVNALDGTIVGVEHENPAPARRPAPRPKPKP